MVVQGPVRLLKISSPERGECTGCFFANLPCTEASAFSLAKDGLKCSVDDYIWEVQSIG